MTFEELKAEANRQGYSLVKKPTYVPLAKCSCGAKRSVRFVYIMGGKYVYKCIKCGLEGVASRNKKLAREYWNYTVEKNLKNTEKILDKHDC